MTCWRALGREEHTVPLLATSTQKTSSPWSSGCGWLSRQHQTQYQTPGGFISLGIQLLSATPSKCKISPPYPVSLFVWLPRLQVVKPSLWHTWAMVNKWNWYHRKVRNVSGCNENSSIIAKSLYIHTVVLTTGNLTIHSSVKNSSSNSSKLISCTVISPGECAGEATRIWN